MNTQKSYPFGADTFARDMARKRLTAFVIERAEYLRRFLGFGFIEVDAAPETYADLMEAWRLSIRTRQPLPVYAGASSDTIYTSKAGNWAFRFWHDVTHCQLKAPFTYAGEVQTSRAQLKTIADRFGADSLEYRLFEADTIGQVEYFQQTGGFVGDQLAYVSDLVGIRA